MILDSGARREFSSGAVRDIQEGKGRCDLLPLREVSDWAYGDNVLRHLATFLDTGDTREVFDALDDFCIDRGWDKYEAILEVSKHYEEGCNKYGERNWEKGLPTHCYIDSGIRHYLKFRRGVTDERHDRAFIWNMLGLIYTKRKHPDMNDLPEAEQ